MNSNIQDINFAEAQTKVVLANTFLFKTYAWMFIGLLITALSAYTMISTGLIYYVITSPFALFGLILVEIGVVIGLSIFANRISTPVAGLAFIFYSILSGITLAPLVFRYTEASVATTFFASSFMFGIMAIYGYYTKQDLSTFGSIAIMGLFGLIIGAVVNIIFNITILHWIITYAGIGIFLVLTAYDMQKLKNIAFVASLTNKPENNIAITGALSLYLDFINLFIFVLRIFGNKK
jgi:FtsH-binding integral membrane protein